MPDQPLTTLVGREQAIREVTALLREPAVRLVTLTGPGGIGKTRLAFAVAGQVGGEVAVVPLAAISRPESIVTAITRALDLDHIGTQPIQHVLRDALRERCLLLMLDNFEHLLAGAPLILELLNACPHLTILTTSRTRLGQPGEHVVPVEPLAVPSAAQVSSLDEIATSSGVRLFVDRAQAVHPPFALTEHNADAIAAICRRLDGLPLAIELAAARSNVLSPQALSARLERRLELLTGGPRDTPERHQTMRATVAWSVELLGDTDRAFWERLSVFAGGFTAEAAEAIGQHPSPLDALATLVDQGLLRPTANAEGEPRFAMLETAREHALDQLAVRGATQAARDAHANYFVAFAKTIEPGLMGAQPDLWFNRTEADIANFRAALDWLRDHGQIQTALELAGALAWFWTVPNYIAEGRSVYDDLIERAGTDVDSAVLAKALMAAGDLADWHVDTERSIALHQRALESWRAIGDRGGMARSMRCLGSSAIDRFAFDEAATLLAEARSLSIDAGDAWTAAASTNLLGVATGLKGDIEAAIGWHEDALRRWQQMGDRSHLPAALSGLAWCLIDVSRDQQACEALDAALELMDETDPDWELVWSLVGYAALGQRHGQHATAVRLLAAVSHLQRQFGIPLRPPHQRHYDGLANAARAALGNAAFTQAWSMGEAMTVTEAVREARTVTVPAKTGDVGLSRREREVLALLVEGASDHEIAAALFITRRTASKHVAAIIEKLGASNRTSAVTIAHRRGLT